MSEEKPLPTFAAGGKSAPPASDGLGPPSSGGKGAPPLTPATDLHSFLHGKQPQPASGSEPEGPMTMQKDRYNFLRSKLRYEFITPEDWDGNDVVKPSDMISAFVEVTSAHGVPHVAFARGNDYDRRLCKYLGLFKFRLTPSARLCVSQKTKFYQTRGLGLRP